MSNLALIDKLPDSIYATDPASNNYKLMKLFAVFMDELDEVFNSIRLLADIKNNSGLNLDLIGKILRQPRRGWQDDRYIKYLFIAIRKYQCSGTIEDLNEICSLLAGPDYRYMRDLNEPDNTSAFWLDGSSFLDGSDYLSGDVDNIDTFWLDGSNWLDGSFYLSGDICQARFFEVVFSSTLPGDIIQFVSEVINSCKSGGIKYRIRLEV